MTHVTQVTVAGLAPYDVIIGHGATGRLLSLLSSCERVLLVADERLAERAQALRAGLDGSGREVWVMQLPSGEAAKSLEVASAVWDELGRRRFTRSDAVVSLGGGATTDVAGFVAATWLRGVRVVHLPTTLLGMVDAAVGGKTGINTGAGKNLVGAFHPPAGVLVDLDRLETLPVAEWVNGMAEVVKAGFIADPAILELVDRDPATAADPRGHAARELIERSVRVKADVVGADLRESGPREVLNYGHTLAHAIERVEDYRMPHGHAVSIGMCFVAALARLAGRLDSETAARHGRTLQALGLPTTYRRHSFDDLLEVMRVDKKARGATLRLVVLDGLARPVVIEAPDESMMRAAFDEIST